METTTFSPLEYLFTGKIDQTLQDQDGYNNYKDFLGAKKFQLQQGTRTIYNPKNFYLPPSTLFMECPCHGSCRSCNKSYGAHVEFSAKTGLFLHKELRCNTNGCELCDIALPPAALSKRYTIYGEKITEDMEKEEILQCWKMDKHTAFCGACLNHMVYYARNRDAEDEEIDSDRNYASLLAICLGKKIWCDQNLFGDNDENADECLENSENEWMALVDPEKLELAFQNVEFDLRSVEQIKAKHAFEEGRLAEDAVKENFKRKLGSEERGRQIEYVKVPGKYIAVKMPGQCAFRNRYADDVEDYTEYVATLVNLCKAKMKRTFNVDTKGSYTMEHFRNHIRERIEGLAGFGGEKSSAMVMLVLALNASALCSGSYLDLLDECKEAAQNDKPMSLFKDTIGDQVKSNMKRLEKENSRLRKEREELKKELAKASKSLNRRMNAKRRRCGRYAEIFDADSSSSSDSELSEEEDDEENTSTKENNGSFGNNAMSFIAD